MKTLLYSDMGMQKVIKDCLLLVNIFSKGDLSMFKKFLVSAISLLTAAALVSCGPGEVPAAGNTGNQEEECTITFSWWGSDERHEATLEAVRLFESIHPEIHVETDYGSWTGWKRKIFDDIKSGEAADLMQVNYDWMVDLSYDGTGFMNLEELGEYIDLSQFDDSVLQFGRRNGVLNAVPASITGRSLFFNRDVFDRAGAELPESWNDLYIAAGKLNQIGSYPLEADKGSGFTAFYISVVYEQQKTGHQFITDEGDIGFDVNELADALAFYKSLQDAGAVRSVEQMKGEEGNLSSSDTWKNGTVAGIAEWGSSVSKYQKAFENPEVLETGELLMLPDAKSTGWMYKPSLLFAVNSESKYPEQSAMLLDFILNNPKAAEILGTTRGIPVSESALNTLRAENKLGGLAYDSTNALTASKPVLISPYFENSEMQKYYNEAIEAVSMELLTPEEAAQGIYANIVYTLGEIKEGLK